MKKLCFKTTFWTMALVLLSLFNYACQDDTIGGNERSDITPGLPATVHLKVNVGNMGVLTRSLADEPSGSYCNNMWIGIYDSKTGECKNKFYITDVASTNETDGEDDAYDITLKTESAEQVYIVAVTNVDVSLGVSKASKYGEEEKSLLDMLNDANDFDTFKSICALAADPNDVNMYSSAFTMSGWFAKEKPEIGADITAVDIPSGENVTMEGAIYLTRIFSYNKFNIWPGKNINLKLNSWKVCNIPAGCFLLEQAGAHNAGDNYSSDKYTFFNSSNADHLFTMVTKETKDEDGNTTSTTGRTFEFYQLENKHYASNAITTYEEREKEEKNADGTNSGVYTNVKGNASYVVINASIDYYVAAPENMDDFDPETATVVSSSYEGKKIHRTAVVDYTIHLGYCEDYDADGKDMNKAQDFNCRRNTKYTYNVTINGVKNVVVEAKKEGEEPEPGAEGWVSDDTSEFKTLDSHYCEFNICFTDNERKNMSYRITAPYAGTTYTYERSKEGDVTFTSGIPSDELYTWIKFYPTSDENTLAEYNGGKGKNSLGEGERLWTFDDMCAPDATPSPYTDGGEDAEKWYTVFVDEYVYHFHDKIISQDDATGEIQYDEQSWPEYVNQDDRLAEFIMNESQSKDKESLYTYCKYAFGQKSIQTFYKGLKNAGKDAGGNYTLATAVGIEHTEETSFLNMRWNYIASGEYDYNVSNYGSSERKTAYYDYNNGRYNMYHYIYLHEDAPLSWSDVIQENVPGHVNADKNKDYDTSHEAADYPVYMPQLAKDVNGNILTNPANRPSGNMPSPSDPNMYFANSICMNRNRDLNGNGKIEPNEIRWYLPTTSIYMQIAIAQVELPDPIIKLTEMSPDYFQGRTQERNRTYNFHYITSDYQYFWAEQAISSGDTPFAGYSGGSDAMAYASRCVRSLGVNPTAIPQNSSASSSVDSEVGDAFEFDSTNRTFTQNNYNDISLRGYVSGGLAPHTLADPASRPYKKFEYASGYCSGTVGSEISLSGNTISWGSNSGEAAMVGAWTRSLEKNEFCSKYSQNKDGSDKGTWRVPSISELSLMWTKNVIQNQADLLSCTHDYFITYNLRNETTNNQTYLGFNNTWDRQVIAMDIFQNKSTSIKVRCVRDVK
jgi:hypothetical protein